MVIDIIILIPVIICLILGLYRGLARTVLHMCGWLTSMIAAYFLLPQAENYIKANTSIYDTLKENVSGIISKTDLSSGVLVAQTGSSDVKLMENSSESLDPSLLENLPENIDPGSLQGVDGVLDSLGSQDPGSLLNSIIPTPGEDISALSENISDIVQQIMVTRITNVIFGILCFAAVMIAIRIAFFLLELICGKLFKKGPLGFLNRLLGGLLGILRGAIWAAFILIAAFLLTSIFSPETAKSIVMTAQESVILGQFVTPENLEQLIK